MSGALALSLLGSYKTAAFAPSVVFNLDAAVGALPGSALTTSASFNGTNQYLTLPASSNWALGTGDFTIEWWQYQTGTGTFPRVFSVGAAPTASIAVSIESGTFYFWEKGSFRFSSSLTGYLNTWVHFAISRVGGQTSVYQNGTRLGSAYSDNYDIDNSSTILTIGRENAEIANTYFPGYLSNFRIIKGTGLYSGSSFTVPNTSLIPVLGTVLLLPFTATPFVDISTNSATVTNVNAVATTPSAPTLSVPNTDLLGESVTKYNPNSSMAWSTTTGGIFRKTTSNSADMLIFGPNYSSTSQAYTVMMVYRSVSGTAGRLLNANTASPDWLAGLWGSGSGVQHIFYNGNFIGSSSTAQDGNWQFLWVTYNGISASAVSQSYIANSSQPTSTFGTGSTNGGFNGLRLFGRYATDTTNTEVVTADVGLVKVWNGVLTLAQIQSQYAAYKTRFGY
jgi:hypothetical protein